MKKPKFILEFMKWLKNIKLPKFNLKNISAGWATYFSVYTIILVVTFLASSLLYTLAMAICIPIIFYAIGLQILSLAKKDILWTTMPENEIKAVVDGADNFIKFIYNIDKKKLKNDDPYESFVDCPRAEPSLFEKIFGSRVKFIGLPGLRKIQRMHMPREKFEEETNQGIIVTTSIVDVGSTFYQSTWEFKVSDIENNDNQKVIFVFRCVFRTITPFNQWFGFLPSGKWIKIVMGKFPSVLKVYASKKNFEEIRSEDTSSQKSDFGKSLLSINEGENGIKKLVGVEMISYDLIAFDIEKDPEIEELLRLRGKTEIEQEAKLLKAKKDLEIQKKENEKALSIAETAKQVRKLEAEAEKNRIIETFGAIKEIDGEELFKWEKIADSDLISYNDSQKPLITVPTTAQKKQEGEKKND